MQKHPIMNNGSGNRNYLDYQIARSISRWYQTSLKNRSTTPKAQIPIQDKVPKKEMKKKTWRTGTTTYLLHPRFRKLRSPQLRIHDPLLIPHRLGKENPPRSDDAGAAVAEHVVCGPGGAVGLMVGGVGSSEGWIVGREVGDLVVVRLGGFFRRGDGGRILTLQN